MFSLRPSPGSRAFLMAVIAAQMLTQVGAFTLPALLPHYIAAWRMTETDAGLLVGSFFGAYVLAVPVLVALTDRVPTRRVYLVGAGLTAISHLGFALVADGFWSGLVLRALAGIGWAGAYMPGLKALADHASGTAQSRAVSLHAAGVGIAGAASFGIAGAVDALAGPTAAFAFGGVAALIAFAIGATVLPRTTSTAKRADVGALLDFRPVLANKRAMAWIAGYTVHTLELAALRAWGVTFMVAAIARSGAPAWLPDPTLLFTVAGLVGIVMSISGNETAQRVGRTRVVVIAMSSAAALSLATGWAGALSPLLAIACVLVWNACIYLDSSALTAGTVQAADPARRGATMGLHSMAGYAGGFVGPLGVGLALDWFGRDTALGWGLGFGHIALLTLTGLVLVLRLGRGAQPKAEASAAPVR